MNPPETITPATIAPAAPWAPVRVERDGDVAVLFLDVPGEPVNTLSPPVSAALEAALARVIDDDRVAAVVIASGKPGFVAGADIRVLAELTSAEAATALSRQGQAMLQRLSELRTPVVAAIRGACLGGGLELALACDARVAADERATRLGLPEVELGLLPGAGGTVRLPRLIGIAAALELILGGAEVDAARALTLGLVDEVCPPALVVAVAVARARALAEQRSKSAGPLARMSDALRELVSGRRPGELRELLLEDNPLGRRVLFEQARKHLGARTRAHYPASEKALDVVRIGAGDADAGYQAEARAFGELAMSPQARALIGVFVGQRALRHADVTAGRGGDARPIERIAILGAGLMGAGVAAVSASAGVRVRLIDRDHASVGRGLARMRAPLDGRVRRGRMTERERDDVLALVTAATDERGLELAELVLESVSEDLALKRDVLRSTEARIAADTIYASSTSAIPITSIASTARHPERVIGMHYLSPVHRMPLVEIVVTAHTAPSVIATCVALGRRQGKTAIVVRDGVGFYTSRIAAPYLNEALRLVAEGAAVQDVDAALVDWGFAQGPLAVLDEIGIDVADASSRVVEHALADRLAAPPGIERLLADGRKGKKAGKGLYRYQRDGGGRRRVPDERVHALLGVEPRTIAADDMARRCALLLINEAAHCFGEGVLRAASDGDVAAVLGLGFPPFRGGPLRWIDTVGAGALVGELDALAARHGRRFTPAPVLVEMARTGARFHGGGAAAAVAPGQHGHPPTL